MFKHVPTQLKEARKAFFIAVDQLTHLNRKLEELSKRYKSTAMKSFRYSLRLRIFITEGVRNEYYEYAAAKADEIASLRFAMHTQNLDDDFSSDDDDAEVEYTVSQDGDDDQTDYEVEESFSNDDSC